MEKNLEIRSYAWSQSKDLTLPAWNNPSKSWSDGFEKLWGHTCEPRLIHKYGEIEEFLSKFSKEKNERFILYIPATLTHENKLVWRLFCDEFRLEYPYLESGSRAIGKSTEFEIPVLAIVIDNTPHKIGLEDLTLVVPHWESIGFLRMCLWSISKYYSEVGLKVLVIDDESSKETYEQVQKLCKKYNYQSIQISRFNKKTVADVGKLIDLGLNYVETKYVCMLDADTIHTSPELYTDPILLLKKRSVVSVGLDTGLAESYHAQDRWTRKAKLFNYDVSYPGIQTITNNLFRVMRTLDAVTVSKSIGFSRQVENRKFRDQIGRAFRRIFNFSKNIYLQEHLKRILLGRLLNSQFPAMPPTGDNGVSANHWMEVHNMGLKVNIPILSYGFKSPKDGVCFQNIGNGLVHIALSTRALSEERREVSDAGHQYYNEVEHITRETLTEEESFLRIFNISRKISNPIE